ncbi:MAG: BamA/TamA family outer membrane protein [Bacteroidia bacterium]
MQRRILTLLLVFISVLAFSQADTTSKNRFFAYPVGFYSPETKLGFGFAGSYSFRFNEEKATTFPSQITFGAAYTTNGQILLYMPFRIYAFDEKFLAYGEAGYYRYTYNFYGIGNDVPWNYTESYRTSFTRIRLNLLYKLSKAIYAGPRIWYENQSISRIQNQGLLDTANISGAKGSNTPGFGLSVNIDTRNNLFYPTKGWFAELAIQTFQKSLGSTQVWSRYLADISHYESVGKRGVFAFNGLLDFSFGDPPFNLMAALGGTKRMRGYYEGRFRDLKSLLYQAEYRNIIKGRFGYSVFGSLGAISRDIRGFKDSPLRYAAGAGLRFRIDRKEKLNLRLDVAFGESSSALYFTVGEAF